MRLKYVERRFYDKSEVAEERRPSVRKADSSAEFINLMDYESPAPRSRPRDKTTPSSFNDDCTLSQAGFQERRLEPAPGAAAAAAGGNFNDGRPGLTGSATAQAAPFNDFQINPAYSHTFNEQAHIENHGNSENNVNAGYQVYQGNQVNAVNTINYNGQSLPTNQANFIYQTSGGAFNGAHYAQPGLAGGNYSQEYNLPIQSNPNMYTQVSMQNQLYNTSSASHPVNQMSFHPSCSSASIDPNNHQVFCAKPSDPFEQLIEEEKLQKFLKYANMNQIYPQQGLLMQQFSVQTQIYEQNYGVPFPYSFQQWISMSIPGQEVRPHSKNPFNLLN